MKPSITFITPALNEEGDLAGAVNDILSIINNRFSSYEIILINDGSTDQTGSIANKLATGNAHIRAVHHERNMGFGYSLRHGYELATKDYVVWAPSDRGLKIESMDLMLNLLGKADIIVPYIANPGFRSPGRQFLSRAYVAFLNILFGLNLCYYNGPVIYRTELIKAVRTSTLGFAFTAEALIRLVKAGYTYLEVPTYQQLRSHGTSKAFNVKNILEIFIIMFTLAWSIRVGGLKKTLILSK